MRLLARPGPRLAGSRGRRRGGGGRGRSRAGSQPGARGGKVRSTCVCRPGPPQPTRPGRPRSTSVPSARPRSAGPPPQSSAAERPPGRGLAASRGGGHDAVADAAHPVRPSYYLVADASRRPRRRRLPVPRRLAVDGRRRPGRVRRWAWPCSAGAGSGPPCPCGPRRGDRWFAPLRAGSDPGVAPHRAFLAAEVWDWSAGVRPAGQQPRGACGGGSAVSPLPARDRLAEYGAQGRPPGVAPGGRRRRNSDRPGSSRPGPRPRPPRFGGRRCGTKVLILTPRGWAAHVQWEAVIAQALRLRGAHVDSSRAAAASRSATGPTPRSRRRCRAPPAPDTSTTPSTPTASPAAPLRNGGRTTTPAMARAGRPGRRPRDVAAGSTPRSARRDPVEVVPLGRTDDDPLGALTIRRFLRSPAASAGAERARPLQPDVVLL